MGRPIAVHPRGRCANAGMGGAERLHYWNGHGPRIGPPADSGAGFLLDLPRAQHLADGDGLELDCGGYLNVCAAPEPVIEITAADPARLLRIAWHLGSRHLPMQALGDCLRIREDHVIAEMVSGLGGRITRREAPFDP